MTREQVKIESQLLRITRQFLLELRMERAGRVLSIESSLEKELGLGSLERAELFRRVERVFDIVLPTRVLAQATVLQDFVLAVQQAHPLRLQAKSAFAPLLAESRINPAKAERLTDVLTQYAESEPNRPHIYLQNEEGIEQPITYGELFHTAHRIAAVLIDQKLRPGETVALMLPTSAEFFSAFFGILFAGAIPVPIYPPAQLDRIEEYVRRQTKILQNAKIRLLISFAQAHVINRLLKPFIPSLRAVLNVTDLLNSELPKNITSRLTSHEMALIQYTSGSTGDPKGVLLSHQNLLANIRAAGKTLHIRPPDVIVSWLPLYHDMGLIGAWLGALYHGVPLAILSPLTFLSRPERWLWAIHYHRGTISASPNFGYELCVNKIDPEMIEGLDLSSWRLALNGAETVHAATLARFSKQFAPYRFDPKALLPVYGLAESSVALTFPPIGQLPVIDYVDRHAFIQQGKAIPVKKSDSSALPMVSCGQALPEHAVRIVDEQDQCVDERVVGILQFRGPSSMMGYYHNSQATQAIHHNGWWDSGDLAYQAEGHIYITGRKKDIILMAGRTLYPQEIETIGDRIPGIRKGCVIAFGVNDPELGTERCIIVAETHERDEKVRQKIIDEFQLEVAHAVDITPHDIILLPPRSLPKTSSGKLQRSACKAAYLQHRLTQGRWPVWAQLVKLFLMSLLLKCRRGLIQSGKIVYTGYCCSLVLLTLMPLWLLILPCSVKTSFRLARGWAKLILKLMFCRLIVEGHYQEIKKQPLIIVSNHASYSDAIVLLASLPSAAAFIAKKELLKVPLLSTFLKKLNCVLVGRADFSQSVEDMARIQQVLAQGRSIVIFPEGTFTYATGLRAFKLGAFKLAADTQTSLCLLGLQGTRQLLRGDEKLLTPSPITVKIGSIIHPEKNGWEEAARLRDLAREQIAHCCGEPPIDLIAAGLAGR